MHNMDVLLVSYTTVTFLASTGCRTETAARMQPQNGFCGCTLWLFIICERQLDHRPTANFDSVAAGWLSESVSCTLISCSLLFQVGTGDPRKLVREIKRQKLVDEEEFEQGVGG